MTRRIYRMAFAKVYPALVAKVERKGRAKAEVDAAKPFQLCPNGDPEGAVKAAQVIAFEDRADRWWQLLPPETQERDGPCRTAAWERAAAANGSARPAGAAL